MQKNSCVGVGLRFEHYDSVFDSVGELDFVEVHAENFFAKGGATRQFVSRVREHFDLSLHATSLGLGSVEKPLESHVDALVDLVAWLDPFLVSDHACFAWGAMGTQRVHGGDLLPLPYTSASLHVLSENVDRIQQQLGRRLLIENVCSYLPDMPHAFEEPEFLAELVHRSGCGLILDLNNVAINAWNQQRDDFDDYVRAFLNPLPAEAIGEIHLAGSTPVPPGEICVDDHGAAVSDHVWRAFEYAVSMFGVVPALVEWDTRLPDWSVLLSEAQKARAIQLRTRSG